MNDPFRIRLDFPNNPAVDDEFLAQNGAIYRWDGTVWMPIGATGQDVYLPLAGGTMDAGSFITLGANPTNTMHATTKEYVDSIATGARMIIGAVNGTNGRCVYTQASGLPQGPLVGADTVPAGSDIICAVAGTIPPDPLVPPEVWNQAMRPGDVLVSDGALWIFIEIPHQTTVASQVIVVPTVFGANDVQAALEQAARQDMPTGGDVGQVLAKLTGADYAAEWIDPPPTGLTDDTPFFRARAWQGQVSVGFATTMGCDVISITQGGGGDVPGPGQLPFVNVYKGQSNGILQEAFQRTNPNGGDHTIASRWIRYSSNNGGSWTAWQRMPIGGDLGQYLPLAGGTLTGPLTIATGIFPALQLVGGQNIQMQWLSQQGGWWTWRYDGGPSGPFRLQFTTGNIPQTSDWFVVDSATNAIALGNPNGAGQITVNGGLAVSGAATINGNVNSPPLPTANAHLVNKQYVDQLVTQVPILVGVINAGTGNCQFIDATVGPVPAPTGSRHYIICTTPGTIPSGPAAGIVMRIGDEIFDVLNGATPIWVLLAVGTGGILTTADQVALIPNVAGTNNVQAGIQVLDTNKVAKAGDSLTGRLVFWTTNPPVAPPATGTGSSTGTRIQLYGPNDGFAIGIESGSVWYNASSNHRFYTGGVQRGTFDVNGLNMLGSFIVHGMRAPTSGNDAANKTYVDARVAKAGDTMSGELGMDRPSNARGIWLRKNNRDANTACPTISWWNTKSNGELGRINQYQTSQWYAYADYSYMSFFCGSGIMRETFRGEAYTFRVLNGSAYANSFINNSDASRKTDIAPADEDEAAAAFDKLKPVRFKWKAQEIDDPLAAPHGKSQAPHEDPDRLNWGFVAQNVEAASPDLVHTHAEHGKAYDLTGLVAVMAAKIKQLEGRLAAVEG